MIIATLQQSKIVFFTTIQIQFINNGLNYSKNTTVITYALSINKSKLFKRNINITCNVEATRDQFSSYRATVFTVAPSILASILKSASRDFQ